MTLLLQIGPFIILLLITASLTSAGQQSVNSTQQTSPVHSLTVQRVIEAAVEQTRYTHNYDPSYTKIAYPNGDVPLDRGVCSDVVIRAFRRVGVDLQKEVHEDMGQHFSAYPRGWGLTKPDSNIDHRRVPNLMTYFKRRSKALPLSTRGSDYLPGDIVAWKLTNGLLHIGIVTNILSEGSDRYKVVHNIGAGARIEDVLFSWEVIGRYRYFER